MKLPKLLLGSFLLLAACHKSSVQPAPAAPKFDGLWKIREVDEGVFQGDSLSTMVMQGKPTDFFNFKTDSTVTLSFFSVDLEYTYKISGDSIFFNSLVHFAIKTHTDSAMVFYGKTWLNQKDYTTIQYNLTK